MGKINAIVGREPMREGEYPVVYSTEHDNVTRIDRIQDGELYWFQVWNGEHLRLVMNAADVAEVHFESP